MMRKSIFVLIFLAALSVSKMAMATADGYWTTKEDAYYHLDESCGGQRVRYPISQQAAESFDKIACSECVGDVWEPYYTGDMYEWPYDAEPWASHSDDFEPDAALYEKRKDASGASTHELNAAFAKYGVQADYCGCYYSISGDLVIALVNPTIERAEQYAQICGGDIWVIEAEYNLDTLAAAQTQLYELIDQWNAAHDQTVYFRYSTYGNDRDYVEAVLDGRGVLDFMAEMQLELHPAIRVSYPALDAGKAGGIPRDPQSRCETDDYALYLYQDSYPVGTDSICVVLETKDVSLMNYRFDGVLYKYADADTIAQLQAECSGSEWNDVFEYADEGFVRLARDYRAAQWGTVNQVLYYDWKLDWVNALGAGLYRLDTGMGVLEFTVEEGAQPVGIPQNTNGNIDFEVQPHQPNSADTAKYSSFEDDARSGASVLAGDRLYWLHSADSGNVEAMEPLYIIVSAPVGNLADTAIVYGPTSAYIGEILDAGDGILFIEESGAADENDRENTGVRLKKISYDGTQSEIIAWREDSVRNLRMAGDQLYYCDDGHVYAYDMKSGKQKTVFETKYTIYSEFEIVRNKLVVSVVHWSDYDDGGIYAVDLDTLETRRLKDGKYWFYFVRDGKLYTQDEFSQYPEFSEWDAFQEGLYVRYSDPYSGESRYALVRWNGEAIENLPGGLMELDGTLYVQDANGNVALADASIIA